MLTKTQFLEITRGDGPAADFLEAYQQRCHYVDDLCDEPGRGLDAAPLLAQHESAWLLALTANPWFAAHKAALVPLMLLAASAWADSNDLRKSADAPVRRAADVVKGLWHEVIFLTAWLCGGWDHLRSISAKFREYDYDTKD